MNRGIIGVSVLVGLAFIGVIALSGMAVGTASATEDTQNTSLGAEISSFMQASSVEATDDVEDGTFEAALNRTEDPDERRALIEARQQRLQERSEQLRIQHEGIGNASDVRNRSMATRVSVGAAGLERSANRTGKIAAKNGVDTEQLDEVRSNARNLRGPEVAALARSIAGPPEGGSPAGNQMGPPDENQTGSPDGTGTGPPSEETPRSGAPTDTTDENETDARNAERGATETDSEGPSDVGGSPGTDTPAENGDRSDSAADGEISDNGDGSNGAPPDHAPGQDGNWGGPDSASGADGSFGPGR